MAFRHPGASIRLHFTKGSCIGILLDFDVSYRCQLISGLRGEGIAARAARSQRNKAMGTEKTRTPILGNWDSSFHLNSPLDAWAPQPHTLHTISILPLNGFFY